MLPVMRFLVSALSQYLNINSLIEMIKEFSTLLKVDFICFYEDSRHLVSVTINQSETIIQFLFFDGKSSDMTVEFYYTRFEIAACLKYALLMRALQDHDIVLIHKGHIMDWHSYITVENENEIIITLISFL